MHIKKKLARSFCTFVIPPWLFSCVSCLCRALGSNNRWVVGGYFVSSSLFNMADLANQFLCPLPPDTESVVVKIINPENNDVAAMAVGSIAPCISAPWWEEVLYRG